jgi:putative tricarboxylic transport membrane protein
MTMQRMYQIAGLVLLALAIAVVYGALQLRYYTSLGPGPGFFSYWIGIVLGILAVLMIAQTLFQPAEALPDDFIPQRGGWLRMGAIVLTLIAATLLMERLGFSLTMFAVFVFLLRSLGGYSFAICIAAAIVASFGIDYLFVRWLSVPLPTGLFGF